MFLFALFISNELQTLTTRGVLTYYFLLHILLKLSPFSDYKQTLGDSPVWALVCVSPKIHLFLSFDNRKGGLWFLFFIVCNSTIGLIVVRISSLDRWNLRKCAKIADLECCTSMPNSTIIYIWPVQDVLGLTINHCLLCSHCVDIYSNYIHKFECSCSMIILQLSCSDAHALFWNSWKPEIADDHN
jgi:hypothetical protein